MDTMMIYDFDFLGLSLFSDKPIWYWETGYGGYP